MSVIAPAGFRAAGVSAGIKRYGELDVALVVNDGPSDAAAGVFTANRVQAAPVTWSRQVLADGRARAVVLNSGGANACTGADGFLDTHLTAEAVAEALQVSAADVVVCSTGLIGERLPMDAVLYGVTQTIVQLGAAATASGTGGEDAARAIMTTDTVPKQSVVDGNGWSVGGMAKGAGMLAPALATMLCVLTTDAVVDAGALDAALREATAHTFDRIDADGCMSTNDTVVLLSSGASGVTPDPADFAEAVESACHDLAMQLLGDAEGVSKQIEIEVTGARSTSDAVEVGRAIARSTLLKCAIFGGDPNWGRVLAAIGTTDASFEADQLDVTMNGIQIARSGTAGDDRRRVDLSGEEVSIRVDLHAGREHATIWTVDVTPDYIHINADYPS